MLQRGVDTEVARRWLLTCPVRNLSLDPVLSPFPAEKSQTAREFQLLNSLLKNGEWVRPKSKNHLNYPQCEVLVALCQQTFEILSPPRSATITCTVSANRRDSHVPGVPPPQRASSFQNRSEFELTDRRDHGS